MTFVSQTSREEDFVNIYIKDSVPNLQAIR